MLSWLISERGLCPTCRQWMLLKYLNQWTSISAETWKKNLVTYYSLKILFIIISSLYFPKIFQKLNWQNRFWNYLELSKNSQSKIKEIQQASLYIRDAIGSNLLEMSWPMKPSELCESAITLQAELDTFLYTLLIGNTEVPTEYPQSVWHLISCFGQDIIHSVTGGRQKPPRQILCWTYLHAKPLWASELHICKLRKSTLCFVYKKWPWRMTMKFLCLKICNHMFKQHSPGTTLID